MIYNLPEQIDKVKELKGKFEIKKFVKTRTSQQNKALHLFFTMLADKMNDAGLEFNYQGLRGQELSMPYNVTIIKEYVWKPIQETLFETDSTTKLTTEHINEILDVLTKFFGERGIPVTFPSQFSQYLAFFE